MLLLMDHPEECIRMGKNARARFNQLFTADIMAARYAQLYAGMLESFRTGIRENR